MHPSGPITQWNRKYMKPIQGYTLQQMWRDAEAYISKKTTCSSDITEDALRRNARELNSLPRASSPDSLFLQDLGKPNRGNIPPQNATFMHGHLKSGSTQSARTKQWLSWTNLPAFILAHKLLFNLHRALSTERCFSGFLLLCFLLFVGLFFGFGFCFFSSGTADVAWGSVLRSRSGKS